MRRPSGSIVASPVLVGAVTTLVVVVAVFLSYNANKGLPFVPTEQLKIELSNGANLLAGNEVREGGERIGIVDRMRAKPLPDGTVGAEAVLKLDKKAGSIPVDSRINIRPRSVLGLKYVEVTRGRSRENFRSGETIPPDQTTYPVDLEDFNRIFDRRTRNASRRNLQGFGDTFAQRGESLNRAISELPRFFGLLEPVARNLADPSTNLARFFKELGDAARVVAPIAERYSHGFTAGADTFEAWSRYPDRLQETISKSAPTMEVGIRSFRIQRPFLVAFRDFSVALENATAQLPRTLPRIIPAIEAGTPVLRRSAPVNLLLRDVFDALGDLTRDPRTNIALRALTATARTLNPTLRYIGPYITVCNYWNYSWTNVGEHLTEPEPTGLSQRAQLGQGGRQKNQITSLGATEPANGEQRISGTPQHFHGSIYGAAIDDRGNADCESGQRGYPKRIAKYWRNERSAEGNRFDIVTDPHIPGNQGPTNTGRPRVPEGQTFTRLPESGPPMPRVFQP